jgi:hypothetical protein
MGGWRFGEPFGRRAPNFWEGYVSNWIITRPCDLRPIALGVQRRIQYFGARGLVSLGLVRVHVAGRMSSLKRCRSLLTVGAPSFAGFAKELLSAAEKWKQRPLPRPKSFKIDDFACKSHGLNILRVKSR